MEDLDLDWMAAPVRRAFMEGVRLYAEAVRDGAVLHMRDGADAMQHASQLHLRLEAAGDDGSAADPAI